MQDAAIGKNAIFADMKGQIHLLIAVAAVSALCLCSCTKYGQIRASRRPHTDNIDTWPPSNNVPAWLELPGTSSEDGFDLFLHDGTLNGKQIRNWSFYWDYDNLVSRWVAYPLYKAIYSGASRTDAWGYDPSLPAAKQQNVSGGYREGNNGWYCRGHLLPSSDRASFELNSTTFYGTNMAPMNQDFNGGIWADLEGKERSWAGQSDTCYVVT